MSRLSQLLLPRDQAFQRDAEQEHLLPECPQAQLRRRLPAGPKHRGTREPQSAVRPLPVLGCLHLGYGFRWVWRGSPG